MKDIAPGRRDQSRHDEVRRAAAHPDPPHAGQARGAHGSGPAGNLRRTFVSLAPADGAHRDIIETVGHGPRGEIVRMYTTPPWPTVCEEVAKPQRGFEPET